VGTQVGGISAYPTNLSLEREYHDLGSANRFNHGPTGKKSHQQSIERIVKMDKKYLEIIPFK